MNTHHSSRTAIGAGDLARIEPRIDAGVDVDAHLHDDSARLHIAAAGGKAYLAVPEHGGNQMTALLRAARGGHLQAVAVLVERSANLTAADQFHTTPLGWAVGNRFDEVAALLEAAGAPS